MLGLRPFFCFYGGKWRDAPHYPAPKHEVLIEPFAGAAGYACRYPAHKVVLLDKDPIIAGLWAYLITAKSSEILALPDVPLDGLVDDLAGIPQEARWLIGFWLNKGASHPCKTWGAWARQVKAGEWGAVARKERSWWGPAIRARIATQQAAIRHWRVFNDDYYAWDIDAIFPHRSATWFIDPPYAVRGRHYRCGSRNLDYAALATWCQTRPGQTIVCEQAGADWLPFTPHRVVKALEGANGQKQSAEVVWYRETSA